MISERFNTVFVHIPKTAGRSIDYVFIREHGLTWETRDALLLLPNADPTRGPCFLTHLYAREYVECGYISEARFAAFFKFAVVRNPYDRFISEFRWRRGLPETPMEISFTSLWSMRHADPFTDEARHLVPQKDFITGRDGRTIVDAIARFERLRHELPPIFERIFGYLPVWAVVNESPGDKISQLDLPSALKRELYREYECDFDTFRYPSGFLR